MSTQTHKINTYSSYQHGERGDRFIDGFLFHSIRRRAIIRRHLFYTLSSQSLVFFVKVVFFILLEQKKRAKKKKKKKEEEFFCVKFEKFCGLFSSFSLRDVNSFCFLLFFFFAFFFARRSGLPLTKKSELSFLSQISFFTRHFFKKNLRASVVVVALLLWRESTSGAHEGDEVMATAADLVARALETFFSSSSRTNTESNDVVTYRTLSRKFAVTARVGKRLLWTILNAMRARGEGEVDVRRVRFARERGRVETFGRRRRK